MPRLTLAPALTAGIAAGLLSLASPAAATIIIDNFETGPVSLSATMSPGLPGLSNPDAAHCIADVREVFLNYFVGSVGTMSITVNPTQGVDDRLVIDYPVGNSEAVLRYLGGPWDLTESGVNNRMTLNVKDVTGEVQVAVQLLDALGGEDTAVVTVSQATRYQIELAQFDDVELTAVDEIWVYMLGDDSTIEIADITVSRGFLVTMLYQPIAPRVLTLLCNDPARGGGNAIGWDWTIDWPNQASLAGSELQVLGVSGPGCARVQFESDDSDPTTAAGDIGYASIDWSASTFSNADFDLRFVTNANGWYTSTLVGTPVVTQVQNSFVISHSVHVENADGVPPGTVEQQVVVAPAPGQEIQLDYLDVIPLGGTSAVGYSLAFGYSDIAYDPSKPLLELYTTSGFQDDAQTTGTPLPAAGPDGALSAVPSITRGTTRFAWSGNRADLTAETLSIFDVSGRRVRELPFGTGEVEWDGLDAAGRRVTTGVYFGRLSLSGESSARVVVLR